MSVRSPNASCCELKHLRAIKAVILNTRIEHSQMINPPLLHPRPHCLLKALHPQVPLARPEDFRLIDPGGCGRDEKSWESSAVLIEPGSLCFDAGVEGFPPFVGLVDFEVVPETVAKDKRDGLVAGLIRFFWNCVENQGDLVLRLSNKRVRCRHKICVMSASCPTSNRIFQLHLQFTIAVSAYGQYRLPGSFACTSSVFAVICQTSHPLF